MLRVLGKSRGLGNKEGERKCSPLKFTERDLVAITVDCWHSNTERLNESEISSHLRAG